MPHERRANEQPASNLIETEGYVIYGVDKLTHSPPEPPRVRDQLPDRAPSDDLLRRSARRIYRTFMVEALFKDGKPTGEYRTVRKLPDGEYELTVFSSVEEAVGWGRQCERNRQP